MICTGCCRPMVWMRGSWRCSCGKRVEEPRERARLTVTAMVWLPEMVNKDNRPQLEALAERLLANRDFQLAEGQRWVYNPVKHTMEAQVVARWGKSPVAGEQAAVERQ